MENQRSFITLPFNRMLEETSLATPIPGGGSMAASAGATACALVEMVAGLTINKKHYEEVEDEMYNVIQRAKDLRSLLLEAVNEDAYAYTKVMEAYKLQKSTEKEKEIRAAAIQASLIEAVMIPMKVANMSFEVLKMAQIVCNKGNKNARTDGYVAAMLARTAVLGAIYNVNINLESMSNQELKGTYEKETAELSRLTIQLENNILGQ